MTTTRPSVSLTREEEFAVTTKMVAGSMVARDLLIRSAMRKVVVLAKQAVWRYPSLDLAELISEGNLSLCRAADTFTPTMEFRFATHARFYIRDAFRLHKASGSCDRLKTSRSSNKQVKDYNAAKAMVREETGYEPSFDEMADRLKLTKKQRAEMTFKLAAAKVASISPVDGDGSSEWRPFHETLSTEPDPAATAELHDLLSKLHGYICRLDDDEADVIKRRYGIGFDRTYTRREVAMEHGRSVTTITTMELLAKRRLGIELGAE